MSGHIYRFAEIEVDTGQGCVRQNGEERHLRQQTFQVLVYLLEQKERLVTKDELLQNIWNGTAVTDDALVQCVMDIRRALGDDSRRPRFIKTIPKLGYRFIAPVTRPSKAAVADKKMLLVLPFENLCGDCEQEYFVEGLTEEMISQLGQLNPKKLGVIARTSAVQYKATKKSIGEMVAELHVDCVLEGSVRCNGRRVRITGQLIGAHDQTNLWSATYDHDLHNALDVQTEVARQIGKALALELLPA